MKPASSFSSRSFVVDVGFCLLLGEEEDEGGGRNVVVFLTIKCRPRPRDATAADPPEKKGVNDGDEDGSERDRLEDDPTTIRKSSSPSCARSILHHSEHVFANVRKQSSISSRL